MNFNRILNGDNLLGNDRKHFQIDSIELIETTPCATRSLLYYAPTNPLKNLLMAWKLS